MPDAFTQQEIDTVYRVIAQRRDMRHFIPGKVDECILARLLNAAHQAPSVGLMQPWRFIRITSTSRREEIAALVDAERIFSPTMNGKIPAESVSVPHLFSASPLT